MARPRIIDDPEVFDMLVDLYVLDCKENNRPLSIPGLCLALGFTGKTTFYQYGERDEFKASVERAKSLIEQQYVENVTVGKADRGNIFLLKAVYKYEDRNVVEVAPMTINIDGKDSKL